MLPDVPESPRDRACELRVHLRVRADAGELEGEERGANYGGVIERPRPDPRRRAAYRRLDRLAKERAHSPEHAAREHEIEGLVGESEASDDVDGGLAERQTGPGEDRPRGGVPVLGRPVDLGCEAGGVDPASARPLEQLDDRVDPGALAEEAGERGFGPLSVNAFATAATAASETSETLPESPNIGPTPRVRNSWPSAFRPATTDPVPATATTPTGWSVPARSAAKASLEIRQAPESPMAAGMPLSRCSSIGKSTPASANSDARTCSGFTPTASRASRTQERIAAPAASMPTSSQLAESSLAPTPRSEPDVSTTTA